jgi:RNA polymerase sigma-70 factor (ECF subfamily)
MDEVTPEHHAMARDELRTLSHAFEQLTPRCREVVWMRRVEDLSQREVATRLGIAETVVEKQIAKAMRRFADALFREQGSGTTKVRTTSKKQLKQ